MKVIDLLNKIANGEEVPKKYRYNNEEYEKDYCYMLYEATGDCCELDFKSLLNDEIEIIEDTQKENKKIEKLDNNIAYCVGTYETRWSDSEMYIVDKINEIIDKVNGE